MENASKALIIAGAVLLAILLIGVGMLVFNAANKPISESTGQMDEQAINMFNSKFTPYIGTKVSGTSVKTLIEKVTVSNAQNPKYVIGYDNSSGCIATIDGVNDSNTYNVTVKEYSNGRIKTLTIKSN